MKSKLRASNTLLNSAKIAVTRRDHFCFLALTSCQDTTTVTYLNPPPPANNQCMLKLRGPGPVFAKVVWARPLAAVLGLTTLLTYTAASPPPAPQPSAS
jgi:hypothetical protein